MAVAKVATGTGNRATGSSASLAVTATSPNLASTGTDVCAIAAVQVSVSTNSTSTTLSATYGGTAMTAIGAILLGGSSSARAGVQLFYLFNPPTGTQNVVATAGGASTKDAISAQVVVFSGVGSVGARQTATTTTHAPTSTSGGYDVRVLSNGAALTSPNQTDEYGAGSTVTGAGDYVRVQSAAGTGSTISFTCTGTATTPLSAAVELTPPLPKIATLTDNCSTVDAAVWAELGGTASVVSGALRLTYDTSAATWCYYQSLAHYDLTDSKLTFEIPDPGPLQSGWSAGVYVGPNIVGGPDYLLYMVSTTDGVHAAVYNGSSPIYDQATGGGTWSATTHRWLQIRIDATTIYFETAPDGTTWTTRFSTPRSTATWSLGSAQVLLAAERSASNASSGYTAFDNIGLPPATGVTTPIIVQGTWTALQRANLW